MGVVDICDKDKDGKRVRKQLEVDFVVNQGNPVSYTHLDVYKRQEFNHVMHQDDTYSIRHNAIVLEYIVKKPMSHVQIEKKPVSYTHLAGRLTLFFGGANPPDERKEGVANVCYIL